MSTSMHQLLVHNKHQLNKTRMFASEDIHLKTRDFEISLRLGNPSLFVHQFKSERKSLTRVCFLKPSATILGKCEVITRISDTITVGVIRN